MAMIQKWVKGVKTIGLFCASLVIPVEMVIADQKPISVVASIKPIHSLVAAVMGDIGTPHLLLEAPSSAHHFTLKPSQARSLQSIIDLSNQSLDHPYKGDMLYYYICCFATVNAVFLR
jgi:ABC-type Zn uptake system ZnuABC Zn-binding protein ZnuA